MSVNNVRNENLYVKVEQYDWNVFLELETDVNKVQLNKIQLCYKERIGFDQVETCIDYDDLEIDEKTKQELTLPFSSKELIDDVTFIYTITGPDGEWAGKLNLNPYNDSGDGGDGGGGGGGGY